MPRNTLEESLVEKIDFTRGECWEWTGGRQHDGYGWVWTGARPGYAHRVVYEWLVGPVPEGLELDHLCRNRTCVNPDHLEPVTRRENILRGEGITAQQARQTHCKRGHPLSGDNLYRHGGHRKCRACQRRMAQLRRIRSSSSDTPEGGEDG